MEIYSLETGNLKLDGGAIFGVVPKTIWNRLYPSDENNLCNMSMRALLIIDGDKKVMIDCGMGDKMNPDLAKFYFLNGDDSLNKSLHNINIKPIEITHLVLTHLHFDHCGGAVVEKNGAYELMFPNAEIIIGKKHWESMLKPNRRERPSFLKENIEPMKEKGKINLIEDENFMLSTNIQLRQFHGHTQGQIVPIINYNGRKLVYIADFIPTSAHVPVSFVCGYDIDPLLAINEKESFLIESVENNYTYFFEHDIQYECCSLENGPKGVRVKEKFCLNDFKQNLK